MNRKILAIMVFAIVALSFNACSRAEDDDDVFLLNKESAKKQQKAADNGYCPLLPYPYDPRTPLILPGSQESTIEHPDGSIEQIIKHPDGSVERRRKYPDGHIEVSETSPANSPNFDLLICKNREEEAKENSLCDNVSKAEIDSIQKIYDYRKSLDSLEKVVEDWQEEVLRIRNDPTRTATVAFSKGQTFVNLIPVFVEVILDRVQLKGTQKNDTLYIKAVAGKNGDYAQMSGMSSCPISLDIALDYVINENIKFVVFGKGQIFQVKR